MKSLALRFDSAKHSATRGLLPLNKPLSEEASAAGTMKSVPSPVSPPWLMP